MELPLAPIPTAPTAGTPPTAEMTLGAIAAINPAAIPVFERLGLDYCCGGRRTLAQACDAADLSAPAVLAMLTAPRQPDATIPRERSWADASMTELADHIEHTHHAFVRDATVRLRTIMPRVLASHAKSDPRLERLSAVVIEFLADMADHMVREERVLFPWLRRLEKPTDITSGPPWSVRRPVECMIHDHDAAGEHLAEMRALTDGFTPPPGACMTYRSMLSTLQQLESDTHIHIHKENNILFPAGIRAEEARNNASRRTECTP